MDTIARIVSVGFAVVAGLRLVYLVGRSILDRRKAPLVEAGIGLLGGVTAGMVLFAAARIAMRIVALVAGLEPRLRLGDNLFILAMFTMPIGVPAGVLFAPWSRSLGGRWPANGLSYGGVLFLLFFPVFFTFGAGDLASSGLAVQVVAVGFVSLSWLLFGITLAAVVGQLDRRRQQATPS